MDSSRKYAFLTHRLNNNVQGTCRILVYNLNMQGGTPRGQHDALKAAAALGASRLE